MTATSLGWADGHEPLTPTTPEVAGVVHGFNEMNQAHQSLWERIRHIGDAVRHAAELYQDAVDFAKEKLATYETIQAEHRERRAPLVRQVVIAGLAVVLDGVACWFAAQALDENQSQTLLWAGLFLAVLAIGEVALDYYRDLSVPAWRLVLAGLAAFVVGLGVLRYLFLSTVDLDPDTALVGAVLFTAATAGFLLLGYRALRAAEKARAWRARRAARQANRAVDQAAVQLNALVDDQRRLVDAYLSRIRITLLSKCTSSQLVCMEDALRMHLHGTGPS